MFNKCILKYVSDPMERNLNKKKMKSDIYITTARELSYEKISVLGKNKNKNEKSSVI